MSKTVAATCRLLFCAFLALIVGNVQAQDSAWLNRKTQVTETKGTRYELLRHISDQTGYLFVYDSQTLNNDAEIQIRKGEYTLRDAIYAITGNKRLQISLIGNNHIVLRLPDQKEQVPSVQITPPDITYFTISGTVYDLFSKETVPSATVGVLGFSIGTVTNREGRFRITLPDSMLNSMIRISHVGYERLEFNAGNWASLQSDFMLEPKVVSLQEVVVRVVNPIQTLERMLEERERNYAHSPAYMTAFYREGVEHKKRNVDLTEAVLKIYKQSYQRQDLTDQVKLVKMRRIIDKQERDTMVTRVKSGILSTLMLDLMKNDIDFLDLNDPERSYDYTHTDVAVIDDRLANVISFEQRKEVKNPLYRGELYVDTENFALLEAHFEMNPKHVEKATALFIEKKSKNYKLTLRGAKYVVSYKPLEDGTYFINHVRGDLEFRVRRKRQWFSSTLNIWFELVNCKVETDHIQPIPRSERLSPRSVFSEVTHLYDADFWDDFNVILPEEELKELIINNLTKVTEIP